MLDIQSVLDFFESNSFQTYVSESIIVLDGPAIEQDIEDAVALLPGDLKNDLKRLLNISAGISIHPIYNKRSTRIEDSAASISFVPECGDGNVWPKVYPCACQGGVGEEFLYWDICGDPAGRIFSVCHDGPWHCLAYKNLCDFIEDMAATLPEECFDRVYYKAKQFSKDLRVCDFNDTDEELMAFVKQFHEKYRIHDLRSAQPGHAFPYGVKGDEAFRRWQNKYFWVERMPKSWKESFRWWWGPG